MVSRRHGAGFGPLSLSSSPGIDLTESWVIVSLMPNQMAQLNLVFQALADPTRRAVVERLSHGPTATSELARPFPMALPSFLQHLDVLQKCGLVRSRKSGRVRTYELAPDTLKE